MRTGRLQHLLHTCSVTPQEVWQWMDGGMFLEATMTLLQAQASMAEAMHLSKGHTNDVKDLTHGTQLQRLERQLKDLPQTIIQQSAAHLSLLKAPPPSLPSPSFLAHYSESFCSVLLLKDLSFQGAISEFLSMRAEHLQTVTAKSTVSSAEEMISTVQSALRFVHAVFLSQTMPVSPLGETDIVGDGELEVLAKVYHTVSSLASTSPLVKAVKARLGQPLPSKGNVEKECASWVQQIHPLVLEGVQRVFSTCHSVKETMELEDALLHLISVFTASYSEGPDVAAGTALPRSVWNGDQWAKGITQLVSTRVEELMKDMIRSLKTDSLHRLQGQPDWGSQPLQLSFTSLTPSLRPQDSKAWCSAVIGDQEVAARYSLIGAQPVVKEHSAPITVALPSALLDPSMVPLAHDACSDFHGLLATVLSDAARAILRERQLELLLHTELTAALQSICNELRELSQGHEEVDGKAVVIGYTSQGLSTIIDALCGPFVTRLSNKASAVATNTKLATAGPVEWRKEDWGGVQQQLHHLYMQVHQRWIQSTVAAVTLDLEANLQRSYFGPDASICRKLHASTWVIKRGEDGALLHLPCMPQAHVFQALYDIGQAIRSQNISMLRLAVVQELHRQLALSLFEVYRKFISDPAAALGYTDAYGSVDITHVMCEEGWLQLLFDVRFIGALLLSRSHAAILGQAEAGAAAPTLGAEEAAYVAVYRRIEESIDLINWNTYQGPLEGVLSGFLHSVNVLFACHAIDHQPWARKEKEKEKEVQREKDERVSLLALTPECDRFPLLPLLPLSAPSAQSTLRNLTVPGNPLLERVASAVSGAPATTPAAPPVGVNAPGTDMVSAAKLVSRISGVTGVKKLWGMFEKA
eukprot:GGOE01017937.1.p1 GENE.GGOE01017937.1~~GGOE01017937.1.p1  ORF type:complete len:978 (-),score=232.04 GGOE01017937.1:140-2740(-)